MSPEQAGQLVAGSAQLRERGDDSRVRQAEALGFWPSDWPIPSRVTAQIFRLVLGISEATFYRWKAAGRFKRFVLKESLSGAVEYCGPTISAWRNGDPALTRSFGAVRERKVG